MFSWNLYGSNTRPLCNFLRPQPNYPIKLSVRHSLQLFLFLLCKVPFPEQIDSSACHINIYLAFFILVQRDCRNVATRRLKPIFTQIGPNGTLWAKIVSLVSPQSILQRCEVKDLFRFRFIIHAPTEHNLSCILVPGMARQHFQRIVFWYANLSWWTLPYFRTHGFLELENALLHKTLPTAESNGNFSKVQMDSNKYQSI